ncbi:short chain dehydrogenase/reductase [Xylona heveae TC161]|uniref:Short chain dehydrogenase/reductase n=1 Tax=Xylona heveae (strain CBS 132557 / TC161) TaxID=1328760 RepID=A0A165IR03_XYLHT|nr:short chain dehydrogenase/reductase [Xylona heveae TC161]KZF25258.1 short chain dehydrogenase/reductase [Xylona heveae TC161]
MASQIIRQEAASDQVSSSSSGNENGARKLWYHHLTVDLLVRVAENTFLHPFAAWMIPLGLRAQATPYTYTSMQVAIIYAILITLRSLFLLVDKRVAYGAPRHVDLSREVIVITGGASGVGLLIAEVYGLRGASVAVLDVRELDATQLMVMESKNIHYYTCDIGDRAQVVAAKAKIEKDLGTPTILINNAGMVNGLSLLELSPEQIEKNFRVNLFSHFYTLQTFLPGMLRKKRGTIVTVASVLGHLAARNVSDYSAAKAGLIALNKALRAELDALPPSNDGTKSPGSNIKTVLVAPGQISTPLFAGVITPSTFLGPVLEPVDVAKEIVAAVDAGSSAELAMPFYSRWIVLLDVLPPGVRRLVRAWSGMDEAMGTFLMRRHATGGQSSGEGEGQRGEMVEQEKKKTSELDAWDGSTDEQEDTEDSFEVESE